jgi:hypothetical protein
MGRMLLVGLSATSTLLLACGGTGSSGFGNGGAAGVECSGGGAGFGGGGGGGSGGAPNFGDSGSGGFDSSSGSTDCTAAAMLVYVIDDMGVLYSFDPSMVPSASAFTMIGQTNCPGASTTNSMAIDRSAIAWVNDVNGNLYKVNTSDASCESTKFLPGQHGFGNQFGMGFSSNADGGTAETLYVDDIGALGLRTGKGLASIDLTTLTLSPIGQFDDGLAGDSCELTGTGDGRLFGFFTNNPATVAQIDKANASILSNVKQAGVNTGTDWAFSFWGGSFYLYTADQESNPTDTSDVTEYDPSVTGPPKVVMAEIGFRIVGAGVSTCAPVKPPPVK